MKTFRQADERMPSDLACAGHRPQARGIHDLCNTPGTNSDPITEEPEEMQVDEAGKIGTFSSIFSKKQTTKQVVLLYF